MAEMKLSKLLEELTAAVKKSPQRDPSVALCTFTLDEQEIEHEIRAVTIGVDGTLWIEAAD
jgi:hypothetical protein